MNSIPMIRVINIISMCISESYVISFFLGKWRISCVWFYCKQLVNQDGSLLTSTCRIILFSKRKKKVEQINFLRFSLQQWLSYSYHLHNLKAYFSYMPCRKVVMAISIETFLWSLNIQKSPTGMFQWRQSIELRPQKIRTFLPLPKKGGRRRLPVC